MNATNYWKLVSAMGRTGPEDLFPFSDSLQSETDARRLAEAEQKRRLTRSVLVAWKKPAVFYPDLRLVGEVKEFVPEVRAPGPGSTFDLQALATPIQKSS